MRIFGRSVSATMAAIPAYSVLNLNQDPVTEGQNFAADYLGHMTDPRIEPIYFGTAIEDYLRRRSPSPVYTVKFVDAALKHAKENNPHLEFSADTNSILRGVHGSWNFFAYKAQGYLQGLRGRSGEVGAGPARQNKFASWLTSSKESARRFVQRAWYGDEIQLIPDDEYARTISNLDSFMGRVALQRETAADVGDNLVTQPEIQEYVGRAKESLLERGARGFGNLRTGLANRGFNKETAAQQWMYFRERAAAPFYRLGRSIDYGLDRAAEQQQIFDSYLQRTVNRENAGKILENTRTKLAAKGFNKQTARRIGDRYNNVRRRWNDFRRRAGEKTRTLETQVGEAMVSAGNSLYTNMEFASDNPEMTVYQRTETERPGIKEKAKNYVSSIREILAERRKRREEERLPKPPRQRKPFGEYVKQGMTWAATPFYRIGATINSGLDRASAGQERLNLFLERNVNRKNTGKIVQSAANRTRETAYKSREWWGKRSKGQKALIITGTGAAALAAIYYFVPGSRDVVDSAMNWINYQFGGAPTAAPTATPTPNIFAQNLPDAREWAELAQRDLLETYETPRNAVEVLNNLVTNARDAGLNLDGDNVKRLADALWKMNGLGNNDNMIHVAPKLEALQIDKWLTGGH